MSERLEPICAELIRALEAIERFQRWLFPPAISPLLENLLPISASLTEARKRLDRTESCPRSEWIRNAVDKSADLVAETLELITTSSGSDMETTVHRLWQDTGKKNLLGTRGP